MPFIDDHHLRLGQSLCPSFLGNQNVQRFRSGDQDVRERGTLAGLVFRRRVARPCANLPIEAQTVHHVAGGLGNVCRKCPQRRHPNQLHATRLVMGGRCLRQDMAHGGIRFAAPCRRLQQPVFSATTGRPHVQLECLRLPLALFEPSLHRRMDIGHRIQRHDAQKTTLGARGSNNKTTATGVLVGTSCIFRHGLCRTRHKRKD